ncbi:MAG: chorismate synthase [Lachnospiraceae bacterium]|nr:chorismate synthase [Lachnospiraceae bacterium]
MASGSSFGKNLIVTTFGESHGKALGCVIDGCPAGMELSEADIRPYMARRKPGQSEFTTKRNEDDEAEILSGVFEGKTTGTPIAIMIKNKDQRSKDYGEIASYYRPGHADYTFDQKFGFRDYRGGGRSSGRETAARVAAGAVALKILAEFGIFVRAYTEAIGPVSIAMYDPEEKNELYMPDHKAYEKASEYLKGLMAANDSAGGIIKCVISGMPSGIGDPVFDKLSARLAHAVMSIGAVKGFEIGDGFSSAKSTGLNNNDAFRAEEGKIKKVTNHSGGILGGISDGSDIVFRCAVKPTPSVAATQQTVNKNGDNIDINIKGRHDPVIVPRAVVVVEAMAALAAADALLTDTADTIDRLKGLYGI